MKFICPLVVVSDIGILRKFYEGVLDQKVKYDFGENVTFHGDFSIHLKSHFQALIDKPVSKAGNNFELYFELDEIDKLVEKLKENDVVFVHQLREQPWKQRVVRFYDPDNNIIEVGESMEFLAFRLHKNGASASEVSKTISMPVAFVLTAIQQFTA